MAQNYANRDYYSQKTGCVASYSDAHHDFGSMLDSSKVKDLVKETTPGACADHSHDTEDTFIQNSLLQPDIKADAIKITRDKVSESINQNLFNEVIQDYYDIECVIRTSEDQIQESKIQKMFRDKGITEEDIYIICDVSYSNLRTDLSFVDKKPSNQTFWWTQVAQTLYDPAGKTAWHTGGDLGFKTPNSNFLFCWQDSDPGMISSVLYPAWGKGSAVEVGGEEVILYNDPNSINEMMLCTNKNIFMHIKNKNDDSTDYKNQESYLFIQDPTNPSNFSYADKNLAAIPKGKLISKSRKNSYRSLGKSFKDLFNTITGAFSQGTPQKAQQELEDFTSETQVIAKKCGDMPQALRCKDKKLYLKQFKDNSLTPAELLLESNIKKFESNGHHMFASYDRIAVVQALNFRVPIVCYCQNDGFIFFVDKNLTGTDPSKIADMLIKNTLQDVFSKWKDNNILKTLDEIQIEYEERKAILLNKSLGITSIFEDIDSDEKYQLFLAWMFNHLILLSLTSDENIDVRNTVLNDKFKKIVTDFINETQELFPDYSFDSPNLLYNYSEGMGFKYNDFKDVKIIPDDLIQLEIVDQKDTDDKDQLDKIKKLSEGYKKITTFLNTKYEDFFNLSEAKGKFIEIFDTLYNNFDIDPLSNITRVLLESKEKQIFDALPKGITRNIINTVPFAQAAYTMRPFRDADVLLDRASQIVGLKNILLPIYEQLDKLDSSMSSITSAFNLNLSDVFHNLFQKSEVFANQLYEEVIEKSISILREKGFQAEGSLSSDRVNGGRRKKKQKGGAFNPDQTDILKDFNIYLDGASSELSEIIDIIETFNFDEFKKQKERISHRMGRDGFRRSDPEFETLTEEMRETWLNKMARKEFRDKLKHVYDFDNFIKSFFGSLLFYKYTRDVMKIRVPPIMIPVPGDFKEIDIDIILENLGEFLFNIYGEHEEGEDIFFLNRIIEGYGELQMLVGKSKKDIIRKNTVNIQKLIGKYKRLTAKSDTDPSRSNYIFNVLQSVIENTSVSFGDFKNINFINALNMIIQKHIEEQSEINIPNSFFSLKFLFDIMYPKDPLPHTGGSETVTITQETKQKQDSHLVLRLRPPEAAKDTPNKVKPIYFEGSVGRDMAKVVKIFMNQHPTLKILPDENGIIPLKEKMETILNLSSIISNKLIPESIKILKTRQLAADAAERRAREYKTRKSNSGGKKKRSKKNKKKQKKTNKKKQRKNKKTKQKRKQ